MKSHTTLIPRALVDRDHIVVQVRVGFQRDGVKSFESYVESLIDAIGVRPGTSFGNAAVDAELDIRLVSFDEDDYTPETLLRGVVEFAIPQDAIPAECGLPLVIALATYGSVYAFVREYQVNDIFLPPSFMSILRGPSVGPDLIPSYSGSTRLGLILKPRFASNEQHLRRLVGEFARAGIDYIIDDELTVGTSGLSFEKRVEAVTAEIGRVEQQLSRAIPYIPNITAPYRTALHLAAFARRHGVAGVMVNTVSMGYDVVLSLAQSAGFDRGIVANAIGRGILTSGPGYRIAPELLCKLARLAGADAVYTGPMVGSIENPQHRAARYRMALVEAFHYSVPILPAAAVMSGGIGLPEILRNERLYDAPLCISMGRELIRPVVSGLSAMTLMECVRDVWLTARDQGNEAARVLVKRKATRKGPYSDCLHAMRAEEALKS